MTQHVLFPYWQDGQWYFDDEDREIVLEPFVCGSSEVLTALVEEREIPDSKTDGFVLFVSDEPLGPGEAVLDLVAHENGGVRYETTVGGTLMTGWLCPNFWKYFDSAPRRLFLSLMAMGDPK
jgi:hypothetical protein